MSKLISETLCVPVAGGQALVEIHMQERFLAGDSLPYSRKRRVKHTFLFRDRNRAITFEVSAQVSVTPKTKSCWVPRGLVTGMAAKIGGHWV